MIAIVHLADGRHLQVGAQLHPDEYGVQLSIDWPDGEEGTVIGFSLAENTEPVTVRSGDTLTIPMQLRAVTQ